MKSDGLFQPHGSHSLPKSLKTIQAMEGQGDVILPQVFDRSGARAWGSKPPHCSFYLDDVERNDILEEAHENTVPF